jgi:hypothetical protein
MAKVTQLSEKVADLKHSDDMLKEYVRIRYQMSGTDRIVALSEWAAKTDNFMNSRGFGPDS